MTIPVRRIEYHPRFIKGQAFKFYDIFFKVITITDSFGSATGNLKIQFSGVDLFKPEYCVLFITDEGNSTLVSHRSISN